MNALKFLFLMLLLSATAERSTISNQRDEVVFAMFIAETHLKNREFILLEDAETAEFKNCTEWLFKDTTLINHKLQIEIQQKFDNPSLKKWSLSGYTNARILDTHLVKGIIRDYHNKGWPYFQKNYGASFYIFSVPIFFNNNTMCLFYIDKHCGELCNEGQIVLYKKVNGKWTALKEFCRWIS